MYHDLNRRFGLFFLDIKYHNTWDIILLYTTFLGVICCHGDPAFADDFCPVAQDRRCPWHHYGGVFLQPLRSAVCHRFYIWRPPYLGPGHEPAPRGEVRPRPRGHLLSVCTAHNVGYEKRLKQELIQWTLISVNNKKFISMIIKWKEQSLVFFLLFINLSLR